MRIPTSSSILFASLAISSSSTCLAAPTGDPPQDSISTSGTSHISSINSNAVPRAFPEGIPHYERDASDTQYLQSRDVSALVGLIGSIPVVGNALANAIRGLIPGSGGAGAQSLDAQSIDQQTLDAIQNGIAQLTHALNGTTAGTPVSGVGGAAAPIVSNISGVLSNSDTSDASGSNNPSGSASMSVPASSSTPYPSAAAAAADDGSATSSSASYSSSAATPSASPQMPGNPPNTPTQALPVNF
ncbi:hypothetical protein CPC08DRAFT_719592 [Agrocybe pediades]|nr:hypothetical protein CPC08DRAFT_719592 [Agrocybe pediades]